MLRPLCAVKLKKKQQFSFDTLLFVRHEHVEITHLKKSWTDSIPYGGLREVKIRKLLAESMSTGLVDSDGPRKIA